MESTSTHTGTFTADQKEYLAGFLTGAVRQGFRPFAGITSTGLISSDPACGAANLAQDTEEKYHGVPLSDLCREELWKAEQNSLDIWDRLLASANSNEPPTPEDTFRFKFHGLFYVAPAQDSFMLRLRIPGGRLTAHQMRGLADMAERYGSGRCDLTTRANMQIREFQPRDIIRVLNTVQSLGLTSRGTGADNIRNITASPTTGLDPHELLDVAPSRKACITTFSIRVNYTNCRASLTLRLTAVVRSACWQIPTISVSKPCVSAREPAFLPASTFVFFCAASPGTGSLRKTQGC